jgi:hypothetical protein
MEAGSAVTISSGRLWIAGIGLHVDWHPRGLQKQKILRRIRNAIEIASHRPFFPALNERGHPKPIPDKRRDLVVAYEAFSEIGQDRRPV